MDIEIQEVENITDPDTRFQEISARLRDVEQTLHQMSGELSQMQTSSDIALGRNRKVVVHGFPELFMKEGKHRKRAARYHVLNLLGTAETPENVAIKRLLCLGRWQGVSDSGCRDPLPALVEFDNPWHRDWVSASTGRIKPITRVVVTMKLDDTAVNRIRSEEDKWGRRDSSKSPK